MEFIIRSSWRSAFTQRYYLERPTDIHTRLNKTATRQVAPIINLQSEIVSLKCEVPPRRFEEHPLQARPGLIKPKPPRGGFNQQSKIFNLKLGSAPTEIRTPVLTLKGLRPSPLDDGGVSSGRIVTSPHRSVKHADQLDH